MEQTQQKLTDLLIAMEQQRNNVANQLAHVQADLSAAHRRIAELEALHVQEATPQAANFHANGLGHEDIQADEELNR